jgi:hypothetical protein
MVHTVPAAAVTRSGTASYVIIRTATGVEVTEVDIISVHGDRAYISGDFDANDAIAADGISVLKALWAAGAEEES